MARSRANASYQITAEDRTRAGVRSAVDNFDRLRGGVAGVDNAITRLTGGFSLLAVAGAAAPAAIIASQSRLIERLGQTSETLGIATAELQAFNAAAAQNGVDVEGIYDSLAEMQLRIAEAARGTGEAAEALDELGLSASELRSLRPEDQFAAISNALDGVANSNDKILLADSIFGDQATEVVRILAGEVERAGDRIEDMGTALAKIDTAAVTTLNSEVRALAGAASGASAVFTAELAPALGGILRSASDLGPALFDVRDASESVADSLVLVVGGVGTLVQGSQLLVNTLATGLAGLTANALETAVALGLDSAAGAAEATRERFEALKDLVGDEIASGTYLSQLVDEVSEFREQARLAGAESKALQESSLGAAGRILETDVVLTVPPGASTAGASDVEREFDRLLDKLRSNTDTAEGEYDARIRAAEAFGVRYPERIAEAEAAVARAVAERDARLSEIAGVELVRREGVEDIGALLDSITANTAALTGGADARGAAVDALGQLDIRVPARLEDGAPDAAAALEDGTAALLGALDARQAASGRQATRTVVGEIAVEDGVDAAVDALTAGTALVTGALGARQAVIDAEADRTLDARLAVTDDAATAVLDLAGGTEALLRAGQARTDALETLGRGEVDIGVTLAGGGAGDAAGEILDGATAIERAFDERADRVGRASELEVLTGLDLTDGAVDAVEDIDAGTESLAAALGRREGTFLRDADGVLDLSVFVDDAAADAARTVRGGTDELVAANTARQDALGPVSGAIDIGIELVDRASETAADIDAGTTEVRAAFERRESDFLRDADGRLDLSSFVNDDAPAIASNIKTGTDDIAAALALRVQRLRETSDAPVSLGAVDPAALSTETEAIVTAATAREAALALLSGRTVVDATVDDAAGEIASLIRAGTGTLRIESADRATVLERFGALAANDPGAIDFTDPGSVLAGIIGDGTAKIEAEYQARLAAIRTYAETLPAALSDVGALEAEAADRRDAALARLATGTAAPAAEIPFDLEFPDFSIDAQTIRDQYDEAIAAIVAKEAELGRVTAETGEARLLAEQVRDAALAEHREEAASERDQLLADQAAETERRQAPLRGELDELRDSLKSELDLREEAHERQLEILGRSAEEGLITRQEAADLAVQIEQEKNDRIEEDEEESAARILNIRTRAAAGIIGSGGKLVAALAGQGERSKKIAARTSQAAALVAGIGAAERAREFASIGGPVAGALAAAASWAGTLANVAGIEVALSGGVPGGPGGSGGGSGGSSRSEGDARFGGGGAATRETEAADQQAAQQVTINILTADEIIDQERLIERVNRGIADASERREIIIDPLTGRFRTNTEAA